MPQAAHHAGLVAHADLAHVDAHAEVRGQLAHELAEVHALLRLEVEDGLVALEQVLHRHGVHVAVALGGHLLEHGQRLAALRLQLGRARLVLVRRDALHGLERAFQLLDLRLVGLEHVVGRTAELGAASGGHDHAVAGAHVQVPGIEPERFRVVVQVNRRYANHRAPLLSRTASRRCTFPVIHYTRSPRRSGARPQARRRRAPRRWPPPPP